MKLRVYFIVLGLDTFYKEVSSPEEAKVVIDSIASFINFHIETGLIPDHCNTAGLEYFDEEENDWFTWYDEDEMILMSTLISSLLVTEVLTNLKTSVII